MLLRKAFGMSLLIENQVNQEALLVVNSRQGLLTMNLRFVESIVAESLLRARVEVRGRNLRAVYGLLGERSIIKHGYVWTWA